MSACVCTLYNKMHFLVAKAVSSSRAETSWENAWQCAGSFFQTFTNVEKRVGFNIFRALHVHVRINEPGLVIYYCALWAVSWEPNLSNALVHSLVGHRVTFSGWCSGCSALPWPSPLQRSAKFPPTFALHGPACDLECFALLGCKWRRDLVVVWRGQFQQRIQTNHCRWNCLQAALCKKRL